MQSPIIVVMGFMWKLLFFVQILVSSPKQMRSQIVWELAESNPRRGNARLPFSCGVARYITAPEMAKIYLSHQASTQGVLSE